MMVYDKAVERDTQILYKRSSLEHSDKVRALDAELRETPCDPQLWMQRGLELAKQRLYREAVESFSQGLSYDPFNWELYRHRGHRLLSTYRFKEAQADFELASRLNPKSWDVWYHLGLAYYLNGDLERANDAYSQCLAITDPKCCHLVAIVNWKYVTLLRMGREEEAVRLLELVPADFDGGEDQAYKDMIQIYKGELKKEELPEFCKDGVYNPTRGYGVAMDLYFHGHKEEALEILGKIYSNHDYWAAFGYLAACCDLENNRL